MPEEAPKPKQIDPSKFAIDTERIATIFFQYQQHCESAHYQKGFSQIIESCYPALSDITNKDTLLACIKNMDYTNSVWRNPSIFSDLANLYNDKMISSRLMLTSTLFAGKEAGIPWGYQGAFSLLDTTGRLTAIGSELCNYFKIKIRGAAACSLEDFEYLLRKLDPQEAIVFLFLVRSRPRGFYSTIREIVEETVLQYQPDIYMVPTFSVIDMFLRLLRPNDYKSFSPQHGEIPLDEFIELYEKTGARPVSIFTNFEGGLNTVHGSFCDPRIITAHDFLLHLINRVVDYTEADQLEAENILGIYKKILKISNLQQVTAIYWHVLDQGQSSAIARCLLWRAYHKMENYNSSPPFYGFLEMSEKNRFLATYMLGQFSDEFPFPQSLQENFIAFINALKDTDYSFILLEGIFPAVSFYFNGNWFSRECLVNINFNIAEKFGTSAMLEKTEILERRWITTIILLSQFKKTLVAMNSLNGFFDLNLKRKNLEDEIIFIKNENSIIERYYDQNSIYFLSYVLFLNEEFFSKKTSIAHLKNWLGGDYGAVPEIDFCVYYPLHILNFFWGELEVDNRYFSKLIYVIPPSCKDVIFLILNFYRLQGEVFLYYFINEVINNFKEEQNFCLKRKQALLIIRFVQFLFETHLPIPLKHFSLFLEKTCVLYPLNACEDENYISMDYFYYFFIQWNPSSEEDIRSFYKAIDLLFISGTPCRIVENFLEALKAGIIENFFLEEKAFAIIKQAEREINEILIENPLTQRKLELVKDFLAHYYQYAYIAAPPIKRKMQIPLFLAPSTTRVPDPVQDEVSMRAL